jgi:cytoskeletal protein RodZ
MTQTHEHDLRTRRPSARADMLSMLILAVILAAIVLLMAYQQPIPERAADTNAGPSVQTVTPVPSPSTSLAAPTPNPTTEQPNAGSLSRRAESLHDRRTSG